MGTSLSKGDLIKWGISVALGAVCLLIPESELITWDVKLFLAITVLNLAFAAFEIVPTIMISVIMPVLWMLCNVTTVDVVLSSWLNTTPLMIVGAFFMAVSLESCGLLRRIAFYLMCKVKASYLALLFAIFLVTVLLNVLTSGRGYIIMGALALGLCASLDGMQKKLGAGLASAVMAGGCTSHIYTYQASGWGVLSQMASGHVTPGTVNPLTIIIHNWPMFFVSFILIIVAAKMFKPEEGLGELSWFKEQLAKMGKITRREKVNAFMLALVLIYTFTVNIHGLDINLGYALIPWIVYLPFFEGADKDTWKKINFDVIFFVVACMSIGTVASSLGFGDAIADALSGLLHGSTNPIIIVGLVFVVVFVLNFLMTPLAIFALITVPVLTMVEQMGFDPLGFTYAINACCEAIVLPYEYVPYLIVFGFGMMRMMDFIKYNIMRSIVVLLGIMFVLTPYWMLIGII